MAVGNILNFARRDAARIINAGGFQTDITFKETSGNVIVQGTATRHHLGYNEDGQLASVKNVHVTVNEQDLIDAGVITRNDTTEVALRGKVLSYADSTGIEKTYTIVERMPNETLGHIVLILADYE